MTTLVTGGAGLFGSRLLGHLVQIGTGCRPIRPLLYWSDQLGQMFGRIFHFTATDIYSPCCYG